MKVTENSRNFVEKENAEIIIQYLFADSEYVISVTVSSPIAANPHNHNFPLSHAE